MKNVLNTGKTRWMIVFMMMIGMAAFGQDNYPKIIKQDYFDFFNSLEKPLKLKTEYLWNIPQHCNFFQDPTLWKEINIELDSCNLEHIKAINIFTPEDITFMISQFTNDIKFEWKEKEIFGIQIIENTKQSNVFYSIFSPPYFSINKSKCLFYISNEFSGWIYFYNKRNDKWIYYGKILLWIR